MKIIDTSYYPNTLTPLIHKMIKTMKWSGLYDALVLDIDKEKLFKEIVFDIRKDLLVEAIPWFYENKDKLTKMEMSEDEKEDIWKFFRKFPGHNKLLIKLGLSLRGWKISDFILDLIYRHGINYRNFPMSLEKVDKLANEIANEILWIKNKKTAPWENRTNNLNNEIKYKHKDSIQRFWFDYADLLVDSMFNNYDILNFIFWIDLTEKLKKQNKIWKSDIWYNKDKLNNVGEMIKWLLNKYGYQVPNLDEIDVDKNTKWSKFEIDGNGVLKHFSVNPDIKKKLKKKQYDFEQFILDPALDLKNFMLNQFLEYAMAWLIRYQEKDDDVIVWKSCWIDDLQGYDFLVQEKIWIIKWYDLIISDNIKSYRKKQNKVNNNNRRPLVIENKLWADTSDKVLLNTKVIHPLVCFSLIDTMLHNVSHGKKRRWEYSEDTFWEKELKNKNSRTRKNMAPHELKLILKAWWGIDPNRVFAPEHLPEIILGEIPLGV